MDYRVNVFLRMRWNDPRQSCEKKHFLTENNFSDFLSWSISDFDRHKLFFIVQFKYNVDAVFRELGCFLQHLTLKFLFVSNQKYARIRVYSII